MACPKCSYITRPNVPPAFTDKQYTFDIVVDKKGYYRLRFSSKEPTGLVTVISNRSEHLVACPWCGRLL